MINSGHILIQSYVCSSSSILNAYMSTIFAFDELTRSVDYGPRVGTCQFYPTRAPICLSCSRQDRNDNKISRFYKSLVTSLDLEKTRLSNRNLEYTLTKSK